MLVEEVDSLSYNDLRKAAKLFNIKTNKKATRLRSELKRAIELENFAKIKGPDLELGCHPVNHVNGSSVHFPSASSVPSHERSCSPIRNGSLRNEENGPLNTTYEVSSPVFSEHTSPVITECQGTSDLPTSVVFTDRLAKPSKPDVPKVVGNTLKSLSVRTVPDFGRIHARAAAKMESLPDYLRRRQQVIAANTKRPPFASPQFQTGGKRTDGKSTLSTLTSVPLADLSNHEVGPPLKRSDPIVFSGHTSICSPMKHGSNRSLNSLSSRLSSKRHTPTIPEDSAFSRRKAYDLKRRLSHTGLLPKRISATNDPPNPSVGPPSSDTMVTVRRRDPVVRSLSAHVAMHKQRAHALSQTLRQGAKQAIISGRRGLLPV